MLHQDWKTVILNNKNADLKKPILKKTIVTTNINRNESQIKLEKIYAPNDPSAEPEIKPVLITSDFAKKMIQARLNKKLTQKDLANKCMLDIKIINEHERGGCVRNGSIITKIKKVLGNF